MLESICRVYVGRIKSTTNGCHVARWPFLPACGTERVGWIDSGTGQRELHPRGDGEMQSRPDPSEFKRRSRLDGQIGFALDPDLTGHRVDRVREGNHATRRRAGVHGGLDGGVGLPGPDGDLHLGRRQLRASANHCGKQGKAGKAGAGMVHNALIHLAFPDGAVIGPCGCRDRPVASQRGEPRPTGGTKFIRQHVRSPGATDPEVGSNLLRGKPFSHPDSNRENCTPHLSPAPSPLRGLRYVSTV